MKKGFILISVSILVISTLLVSGCAVNFYKQSPRSKQRIKELEGQLSELERQRMEEQEQFEALKKQLEGKLSGQIARDEISLRMKDGGLVIILSDTILFDSGKAEIKTSAYSVLDKIAALIKKEVPDKDIGVAGHTDNVPIKLSGWKSNWELSTARATNVLHYLVKKGVSPERLSATGYGEHRPIDTNATAAGRAKNRRVEIMILPEFQEKREAGEEEIVK